MSKSKTSWIVEISKKTQNREAITFISILSSIVLYSVFYQFVPFTSYSSGLILSMLISVLVAFPMGRLVNIYNHKLRKQTKEITKNDEVKSQLISILGHDIKSPLNNVRQILELIGSKQVSKKELEEISYQLLSDVDSTLALTNNLINWIKLQNKGFAPNIVEVNIKEIVQEIINLYATVIKKKSLRFNIIYPDNTLMQCDTEVCKIIFRNILTNAIKYSHENGVIDITIANEYNMVILQITDYGVGMSKERIEQLMQKELIPSQLGTNREKGTGIGLTITQQMIHRLGGQINVESTPNIGTTFTIKMPQNDMAI